MLNVRTHSNYLFECGKNRPHFAFYTNSRHRAFLQCDTLKRYIFFFFFVLHTPRITPNEWQNPHPCNPRPEELENSLSLLNCLWFSLGSILCQGSDILPRYARVKLKFFFFSQVTKAKVTMLPNCCICYPLQGVSNQTVRGHVVVFRSNHDSVLHGQLDGVLDLQPDGDHHTECRRSRQERWHGRRHQIRMCNRSVYREFLSGAGHVFRYPSTCVCTLRLKLPVFLILPPCSVLVAVGLDILLKNTSEGCWRNFETIRGLGRL